MQEVFIKKYWKEEDIWFHLHFQNGEAITQIELNSKRKVILTLETPQQSESMLYDKSLDELDLEDSDFIKEEFEETLNYQPN